jgi:hypothetical protein
VGDRDRQHSGNFTSEGDNAAIGGMHRSLGVNRKVDSPVTAVCADRLEVPYHVADNGGSQPRARARRHEKGTKQKYRSD